MRQLALASTAAALLVLGGCTPGEAVRDLGPLPPVVDCGEKGCDATWYTTCDTFVCGEKVVAVYGIHDHGACHWKCGRYDGEWRQVYVRWALVDGCFQATAVKVTDCFDKDFEP